MVGEISVYLNKADEVMARYGVEGKKVLLVWHQALNIMANELQRSKKIRESQLVFDVVKKA